MEITLLSHVLICLLNSKFALFKRILLGITLWEKQEVPVLSVPFCTQIFQPHTAEQMQEVQVQMSEVSTEREFLIDPRKKNAMKHPNARYTPPFGTQDWDTL